MKLFYGCIIFLGTDIILLPVIPLSWTFKIFPVLFSFDIINKTVALIHREEIPQSDTLGQK